MTIIDWLKEKSGINNTILFTIPLPQILAVKILKYGLPTQKLSESLEKLLLSILDKFSLLFEHHQRQLLLENNYLRLNTLKTITQSSSTELDDFSEQKAEITADRNNLILLLSILLDNNSLLLNYWKSCLKLLNNGTCDTNQKKQQFQELSHQFFTDKTRNPYTFTQKSVYDDLMSKYLVKTEESNHENSVVIDNRSQFSFAELFPIVKNDHYNYYKFHLSLPLYKKLQQIAEKNTTNPETLFLTIIAYLEEFQQVIEQQQSPASQSYHSTFDYMRKTVTNQVDTHVDMLRESQPKVAVIKYSLFELIKEVRLRAIQLSGFFAQFHGAIQIWESVSKKIENAADFSLIQDEIKNFVNQLEQSGAFAQQ